METWQKTWIEKNLLVLMENTSCSEVLKAALKAKGLLSNEEDERLTALGRNDRATSEAKMLYEIMMTRSKGYTGLMEVLCDRRQDGAFKILQDGLQQKESQEASADFAAQLLKMRLQLANRTKNFNDVFPSVAMDDAIELLRNTDLSQEFEEMLRKEFLEIKLDGQLPLTPDLYIPRQLSNRLHIDPKVFSLGSCVDVFVFTNISRKELAQLVKPHAVRSSTNQRSLVTGRHIYLDEEEDWDDMVAISKSPIHLISKEEQVYILQRTNKVTDVLQNYVLRNGRGKEAFVSEDTFVEELLSDNSSHGALICDVAGMGKTWLMQSLASKIREKNQNFVVFYIDLPSFSKFLTAKDDEPPDNQALAVILNNVCNSKLASHLLQKYAVRNALKIVFVLDGYDQLNKDDIVVKSTLLALSKLDHIRMIISSRPIMRSSLQQSFNLISHDILPFQTADQVRCFTEHWANVCHQTDSESCKLEELALQCIKSVKSIQNDDIHDFLGVPLKCRILATVNEQQAKQLCKPKRRRPLQIVQAATINSVFDLYTIFVDALIDKMAGTLPLDAKNDFVTGILPFYTHMALELLFPELSKVYLKNCKIDFSMEKLFRHVGVACVNHLNQRLEFIHRSFAEYFVGRFFAEFWTDNEQYSQCFVHMVGSYFIRNVMIAADGAFTIHPNPSKLWIWRDFIEYEPWFNANVRDSFALLKLKKTFHLKNPLVLMFMNMNLEVKKLQVGRLEWRTNRFRNVAMSYETEAFTPTQNLQPVDRNTSHCGELCGLKKLLAKSSVATIMGCIGERFTNILYVYIQILTYLFDPEDRVALLPPNAKLETRESTKSAAWLLCKAAMSKSPENAVELFNLFGDSEENFLSVLCQRYPLKYWSPLEVAIITEDLDMILYFLDKVGLPFYRLFFVCVAVDKELTVPDVDAKLNIMKIVLGSSDRVLNFLGMDSLYSYRVPFAVRFTKYSFQLLLKFLEDSKRSIGSIKSENKRFILENCLLDCNDEEVVNLLLSLYGKSDDKKLSILNLAEGRTIKAEVVLDALNMDEVNDVFSKVNLDPFAFENCSSLETLKLYIAIQPDFSHCNKCKWNYLHVAASTRNIDWVKHLINSGYEVDQLDADGHTPLLCAYFSNRTENLKSLLAVTRLLVENGANVYAKPAPRCDDGQNVAHRVLSLCRNADSKDLCEWVSFTLENGYYQLWEMRNHGGKTPQEILIDEARKNDPMAADVLRLLESYSVVSTK